MDRLTSDQKLHAMRLIASGEYGQAITFLSDMTKVVTGMTPISESERHLWNGGFKIQAIKDYRIRIPGSGLKDTKDLFEQSCGCNL